MVALLPAISDSTPDLFWCVAVPVLCLLLLVASMFNEGAGEKKK